MSRKKEEGRKRAREAGGAAGASQGGRRQTGGQKKTRWTEAGTRQEGKGNLSSKVCCNHFRVQRSRAGGIRISSIVNKYCWNLSHGRTALSHTLAHQAHAHTPTHTHSDRHQKHTKFRSSHVNHGRYLTRTGTELSRKERIHRKQDHLGCVNSPQLLDHPLFLPQVLHSLRTPLG